MDQKTPSLKKTGFTTLMSVVTLSTFLFFIGCNDESEELDSLAGTYAMQQVKVMEDYSIDGQVIIPEGEDITAISAAGILESAPCSNQANATITLQENYELFLTCIGESNEDKAGTWDENSSLTKLTLSLSSPPFPTPLQLVVNDITRSGETITGIINPMSLSGEQIAEYLEEGMEEPLVVLLNVQITFKKVGL